MAQDARKLKADAFRDLAIVFADPPYADSPGLWLEMEGRIRSWLAPGGLVVWETESRTDLTLSETWDLVDSRAYSAVKFHLLQPKAPCPGFPSRPS
jgi:16S rRNA G966 N2-methylase RsmD